MTDPPEIVLHWPQKKKFVQEVLEDTCGQLVQGSSAWISIYRQSVLLNGFYLDEVRFLNRYINARFYNRVDFPTMILNMFRPISQTDWIRNPAQNDPAPKLCG